ncbi:MAG: hypothetical protein H0X71_10765 [Rubrobacter sp.]|nr:hypothetical protein [Rubrobacter sp.]
MYDTKKVVFALTVALVLALAGCGNEEQVQNDASTTNEDEGRHLDVSITTTEVVDGTQDRACKDRQ